MQKNPLKDFSIGDLAARSGTKVETIRYYEKAGLMPQTIRTSGNHRTYTKSHADRLAFIRHGRELSFSLADIRALLDLADDPGQSCEEAAGIAQRHLAEVRNQIARFKFLEAELQRMVDACSCASVTDCQVIEVLAHSLPSQEAGA